MASEAVEGMLSSFGIKLHGVLKETAKLRALWPPSWCSGWVGWSCRPARGPHGTGLVVVTPFVLTDRAWLGPRARPGGGCVAPAEG